MKGLAKIFRRPLFFGFVVFFILFFLTQYLTYQRFLLRKDTQHKELINVANAAKERLQSTLNYSLATTKILAFLVEQFGKPRNFDSLAQSLLRSNKFIDAVQLTRKGIIIEVYPLKGNESVIGYDILADSNRNREALKAISKKELFFSGPFELKQGGLGIVGRQPIFIKNEFWGFAAVVIRLPTLLREAGINNSESSDFAFELSKINPNTQQEEFFLHYPAKFNEINYLVVDVPDGEWKLYVQRKKPTTLWDVWPFAMLGLTLSILSGIFAWYLAKQPQKLSQLVIEQTKRLSVSEKNYRTLVESITDAFVAIDRNWQFTYMNKRAGQVLGRDPKKMIGRSLWKEFPEDKGQPFHKAYEQAMQEGKYVYLEAYYKPYGLWFENHIYPTDNGIAVFFQDITDRKKSEARLIKMSRLYDFSRQVNQMIIDENNEPSLYQLICDVAVTAGKYKMAWIGMLNEEKHTVLPVSYSGEEKGYLKDIKKFTAVQEGKTIVCNDIENDPLMESWREAALEMGYQSSISLPLKKMGKVVGCFSLYASEKNFFDQEELDMLERIAVNISYSLDHYEKEKLRRQAEKALKTNEHFIQSLINATPGIIYIYDIEERRNIYSNEGIQKILGYSDTEIKNMGNKLLAQLMHPDDFNFYQSQVYPRYKDLPDNQFIVHEFRMKNKEGEWQWLLAKESIYQRNNDNRPKQIFGMAMDISERKRAEQEIIHSYEMLELAEEIAGLGSWEYDVMKQRGHWSKQMFRLFGLPIRDTPPDFEEFLNLIHPQDRSLIKNALDDMAAGREPVSCLFRSNPLRTELRYLMPSWFAERDKNGQIIRYLVTAMDVTKQHLAEAQIIREKELSDSIINSLPGVFYLYNKQGKFYRWNLNFKEITGYTDAEIENMHPLDFFDSPDKNLLAQKINSVFINGEDTVEANFLLKSGEKIPYYFTGRLIDYQGEPCLIGVGIDISERIRAQEEIRRASEALRQLTAHLLQIKEEERKRIGREIHDELGQQLTAIKMDVAWIEKKTPAEADMIKQKLKNIITLLDSSNLSIRKILNELRMGILEYQTIEEALRWQAQQFTDNTSIPVEFNCPQPIIKPDEMVATCLFRVFQESLTNITRYAKAKKVITWLTQDQQFITLSIEDDGIGFDASKLGTAASFGILGMKERVASLNGVFELKTAPGKGTRIVIKIPVNPT